MPKAGVRKVLTTHFPLQKQIHGRSGRDAPSTIVYKEGKETGPFVQKTEDWLSYGASGQQNPVWLVSMFREHFFPHKRVKHFRLKRELPY